MVESSRELEASLGDGEKKKKNENLTCCNSKKIYKTKSKLKKK